MSRTISHLVVLFLSGVLWSCVLCLQRPPPRYSQQYMPDTSFTCRNKIVGSYYADPETDCQLFHVCVSVAGVIQDYRFLCPNDTAFDQESQTCADWYDVDCEAATLYYASDNFDLYRIGSGLESLHYDSLRSDAEPQDHLQRSESNDPVRSPVNRVSTSFKDTGNYYNNRKSNKDTTYEEEKSFRQDSSQDTKKKNSAVRKVSRKQQFQENYIPSTTVTPTTKYYNNNNNNNHQRSFSTTTVKPIITTQTSQRHSNQANYNGYTKDYTTTTTTTQRPTTTSYSTYSTYRPSSNYQETTTTPAKASTSYYNTNSFNNNNNYNSNSFNNQNSYSSTVRPSTYSGKNNDNYSQYSQTTTVAPVTGTNYFPFGFQQRTYNSVPRVGGSSTIYPSTTVGAAYYDSFHSDSNSFKSSAAPSSKFQTATSKYYSSGHLANNYSPTTYSPVTKKTTEVEKSNKRGTESPSSRYYESTDSPKKTTKYSNYEKSGKYYETSTSNYDFGRSSAGIGFSPSSINHLAESPRSTTPAPRRAISTSAYTANDYDSNTRRPTQSRTTARGTTYVSESARPFSTTVKFTDGTTARPKSTKKNDYDYAYYDNAGPAEEYEGLDLEHVTGNKESAKLIRN